jgi:serine/threonine protein kinase
LDPARYQQVKSIFSAAASLALTKRASYLQLACGDDHRLRAEVEALLASDEEAETFLSAPALNPQWLAPETQAFSVGQTIGPYTLKSILGEGGMGTVFLADQSEPVTRKVALKLLKRVSPSAEETARFELERQVLAMLQHSGIAKILDAGQTSDGNPFYVMEYVEGDVLSDFCDQAKLSLEKRMELFLQLCDAVDYAHRAGVIHRDLKPSNVLVRWEGKRSVATIIDFGIAKGFEGALARAAHSTQHGTILGTPAYMSPEQARGDLVSTATDVYALGVILYELLVGRLPFETKGKNLYAIIEQIIDHTPPTLAKRASEATTLENAPTIEQRASLRNTNRKTYLKHLGGDLDLIVQKALEKQPSDRYGSAHELAADLRQYLAKKPIAAHQPQSWAYRGNLWRQRHKALFGGMVVAASSLLIGVMLALWGFFQAVEFGQKASYEAAKAQAINSFLLGILGSSNTYEGGRDIKVIEALDYAVDRLDREYFADPRVEMGIRLAIAETYAYTNRLQSAQDLLHKSLPIAQQKLGEDARETLEIEIGLAFIRGVRGEHRYAEQVFRRMLPIFENRFGLEDETTLFLYSCLINALVDQERFSEALKVATPVYQVIDAAIAIEPEWTQHVEVLDFMNQYAQLLDIDQQHALAQSLMDRVIAWKASFYGEDHNDTLFSKTQAAVIRMESDSTQVDKLENQLLPKLIERFGSDNISTATAAANFTTHLMRVGRWETALTFADLAYRARLQQLGYSHRETFASERQLCQIYWALGEIDLLDNLLQDRGYLATPNDISLWRHLTYFALQRGNFEEARTIISKVPQIYSGDAEISFYRALVETPSGKLDAEKWQQLPETLKVDFAAYLR